MAVPKKRTSSSKSKMRRSHLALSKINIVEDKTTGNLKRPHHMSLKDGTYKNRQVIIKTQKESNE
jgi:large subunit ribosomal protein L32